MEKRPRTRQKPKLRIRKQATELATLLHINAAELTLALRGYPRLSDKKVGAMRKWWALHDYNPPQLSVAELVRMMYGEPKVTKPEIEQLELFTK